MEHRPPRTPAPELAALLNEDSILLERIEKTLHTGYRKWVFHSYEELPDSLYAHLKAALPYIAESEWDERADFGGLYVNGYSAPRDQQLPCPCIIEYYEPKFLITDAKVLYPAVVESNILFNDGDLVIVNKPARLPSVPAKDQRLYSLKSSVQKLLGKTVHMPSRLDVSVQGLVAISTSERMHSRLQRLFECRQVHKEYRLRTAFSPPSETWSVDANIDRDPRHAVLRRVVVEGGKPSQTKFTTLNSSPTTEGWIVAAEPITGRTHQIRVHAAHSKIPINGDNFYGGKESAELNLLSYRITFIHPLTQVELQFELPEDLRPEWLRRACATCPHPDMHRDR